MCFIGRTDTGGYESGEFYYNKVKHVFSEYETLWNNLRDVGTDGCSAMRSRPDYAGVSANEDIGESFIAFMNRDLCPRKLLAFHSVFKIVSQISLKNGLSTLDYFTHILQGHQNRSIS